MEKNKIGIIIDNTTNSNYAIGNSIVKYYNVYERVLTTNLTPATKFGIHIKKYKNKIIF